MDVGAHDGKTISNTYFFEKELGWKGICIEPILEIFKELNIGDTVEVEVLGKQFQLNDTVALIIGRLSGNIVKKKFKIKKIKIENKQKNVDLFNDSGLDWNITGSNYDNDQGVPTGKTWQVQVDYIGRGGKPTSIHGVVRAAGAGTVEHPLERYDIVAYFV